MSMKFSQQLRMTPQLQQAIKLLQLSKMEMDIAIRKELNENPVLEEIHEVDGDDPAQKDNQVSEDIQDTDTKSIDDADPRKQDEFDWESYVESQYKPSHSGEGFSDEVINYENLMSTTKTLHEHLTWQASMSGFNDEELQIVNILINYINDDGYCGVSLEKIAEHEEDITRQDLEEVLPFVQEFDPPGVGARNLEECLLLQAQNLQEDTHDLVYIIKNHLKNLEKKNFQAIAKDMNVELDYAADLCHMILNMDPKPGRLFLTPETHFVTPDVYVQKVADEYVVLLNEDGLPRLKVSNLYKNLLQEGKTAASNLIQKSSGDEMKPLGSDVAVKTSGNKGTQDYIQNKLRSAVWLIRSIHQRQRTIYKVTESIVRHQTDFLDKGPSFIKPMILKDIANDIEMHESTVSRVTTNKYAHTPHGIFELKYFFSSGIHKTDGAIVASESVKLKVKKLIEEEDPKHPFSDQKIVDILSKDGINIARRTVAKYRESLKILSSSQRKKFYI